ncbi:DDE-type integrase/transposase/recombinase [Paraburkholderia strydomiana]|uniref:DDE-type integrase/transposase/recombinase n=1 Tax=Paraburkholderia strydomiana TaxID=1245417 RepID=UPI0038BA67CA
MQPDPCHPDEVWVTDTTYIGLASGFAYLAAIIDACSRRIVGYAVSRYIDTELALAALDAAVESRRPEHGRCIHHSEGAVNMRAPPTGKRWTGTG